NVRRIAAGRETAHAHTHTIKAEARWRRRRECRPREFLDSGLWCARLGQRLGSNRFRKFPAPILTPSRGRNDWHLVKRGSLYRLHWSQVNRSSRIRKIALGLLLLALLI